MACSNNVVRCALTPKYRDVDLLVDMLTYNMCPPPVIRSVEVDECRRRFTPPTSEFEIEDIQVSDIRKRLGAQGYASLIMGFVGKRRGRTGYRRCVVESNSRKLVETP